MDNRYFVIAGIIIALLIGVVAVFLASSDPDGLESTALIVQGDKTLTGATPPDAEVHEDMEGRFTYNAPFTDYSLGESMGNLGGVLVIVSGTLLAFVAVWGLAKLVARRRSSNQ
jgi:cobalt/nickel transport protein